MDFEGKTVERTVYSLFDLLADLGGAIKGLLVLCGAFILPISEFSFVVATLKKFYFVKVSEECPDLFFNDKKRLKKLLKRREPGIKDIDIDKEPRLRNVDAPIHKQVMLFIFMKIKNLCCCCKGSFKNVREMSMIFREA